MIATLLLSSACSRQKHMSLEELRSDITSAISLASETETFLEIARQQRTSRNFARGHLEYLGDQATDLLKEFRDSIPDGEIAAAYPDSRSLVSSLTKQLSSASAAFNNPDTLGAIQQHIATLRKALEDVKPSL